MGIWIILVLLAGIAFSTVGSLHFINILRFNRVPVFLAAKRYVISV